MALLPYTVLTISVASNFHARDKASLQFGAGKPGDQLSPFHLDLIIASAISPEVARERGYRTEGLKWIRNLRRAGRSSNNKRSAFTTRNVTKISAHTALLGAVSNSNRGC